MMKALEQQDRRFHGLDITLKYLCTLKTYAKTFDLKHIKHSSAEISGEQHSNLHGRGMDFDEVRIYQAGDDIRSMDWPVTARTGKPHTKLYKEEREQPTYIITDLSSSMHFGTQVTFKSIVAIQIAALLAWHSLAKHNRVGGIIYDSMQTCYFKPKAGERSTLYYLKKLLEVCNLNQIQQNNNTLTYALTKLHSQIRAGSIIFIISDFLNFNSDQLKKIISKLALHNQLMCIQIYDQLEAEAPKPNRYTISNGEETFLFDSASKDFCYHYAKSFLNNQEDLKKFCLQNRIHLLTIKTRDDIINKLQRAV